MRNHSRDNSPSHGDDVRVLFGVGTGVCSIADIGRNRSLPRLSLARCDMPVQLRRIFEVHWMRDKVRK